MVVAKSDLFQTAAGHITAQGVKEWRERHPGKEKPDPSLIASVDPQDPLYPWQLYSILGPKRIEAVLRAFYNGIYDDDDNPWFKSVFEIRGGPEHHIRVNTHFWIDALGGGKQFYGGDDRLNYFHTANAKAIMTADGAGMWMRHMRKAVFSQHFDKIDPRINPCIMEFLRTKMGKYAKHYKWKVNEFDFMSPSRYCVIM